MFRWIVNPVAGQQQARTIVQQFFDIRPDLKDQCVIYYTEFVGHGQQIATSVLGHNTDVLVVMGGDGTLQEVLNGLALNHQIPIAFIPTGTGNDFARGIEITKSPLEQLQKIFSVRESIQLHLGVLETEFDKIRFTTSAGVGLDADVAEAVNNRLSSNQISRWNHKTIYIRALLKQIIFGKTKNLSLNVDGSCIKINDTWLVTISLLPYFGGGLKIAPEAHWSKNELIITIVEPMSRWVLLVLLTTLFVGQHTRLKSVHTYHANAACLEGDSTYTYQVDGSTGRAKRIKIGRETHFTTFLR